ncbi:hypothetical protein ACFYWX_06010 [Streptomyces sp. NPDC002888]|uniref:hypothetical protein n=1 Tax=Streptomyces sp. NPDC002888 TaxID=3364668 RepID=UPI0036911CE1
MSGDGDGDKGSGGKDLQAVGLEAIAQGITLTLAELKELGIDSLAGSGRGFEELALSGLELGHEGLTSTFKSFCERWEWGVRNLVIEGNVFAQNVGLSAGTMYETDQYVEGALKIGANSLMGNPYASEDEVTQMGWGQIASTGMDSLKNPDYSEESFDQAWDNSVQGWKDAGRDVMTSQAMSGPIPGPLNVQQATGVSDEQYETFLDATFGPSAEERAEQPPPQQHFQERQGEETG